MRIKLNANTAAAIALPAVFVLAGTAALYQRQPAKSQPLSYSSPAPVATVAHDGLLACRHHVEIVHDVHWAAACMKNDPPDDLPDCMLPMERAAILNAARNAAESRCEARPS